MIIKLSKPKKGGDKYLKKNSIGYGVIVLSAFIIMIGIVCWLFFGTYNVTVNGYADVVYGRQTHLFVDSEDIDKVKVGMNVSVGNERGKIINIYDYYDTYENLFEIYGSVVDKFNLSKDKTYYAVVADIENDSTGIKPFSIVVDTVKPYKYYFLGRNNGED